MTNFPNENNESDVYTNWLEESIICDYLNYYEYSNLKNLQLLAGGGFGRVYTANWKDSDVTYAIKVFNNYKSSLKEIVNEIKLHKRIGFHPNIVQFCGITKIESDTIHQSIKYSLVLEYADSGTLETYLCKHFNELDWNDKCKLAFQLTKAVAWMHGYDIIHRDLHANNVLVHQKNIKLTDFGLSRKISEASSNASIFGMIPYIDPKRLDSRNKYYKLNKKSDIYSIGVLMWQISSGQKPFHNEAYDVTLALGILCGKREKTIEGTPKKYSNLYKGCWKHEEGERPSMKEIVSKLRMMIDPEVSSNANNVKEENYLITGETIMNENNVESSELIDLNRELAIESNESSKNIDLYSESAVGSNESSENIDMNRDIAIEDISSTPLLNENSCSSNAVFKNDKNAFDLVKKFADEDYIDAQYQLGYYYDKGIGTEIDKNMAFQLYLKAAKNGNDDALYELSLLYESGEGVDKNEEEAFKSIKKLAEKDYINAIFILGNYYKKGIGTEEDKNMAFQLYKKAAEYGNDDALYELSLLHESGEGVDKNEKEAFKLIKKLAKKDHINAIFQLGNYYKKGIGTKKDKNKAFQLYEKAAEYGNDDALYELSLLYESGEGVDKKDEAMAFELIKQLFEKDHINAIFQLGYYYDEGIGTNPDENEAFRLYKLAADKGNNDAKCKLLFLELIEENSDVQFLSGYYFEKGIGTKIDKNIAFQLYEKAAENGNDDALYELSLLYESGEGVDKNEEEAFNSIKKLAEKGHVNAIFILGNYYKEGIGIKKDKHRAFQYYKEAAENGNDDALYELSLLYDSGEGVNKNEEMAFKLIKKLAEKDHINAIYRLGCYYFEGIGTEINILKAIELRNIDEMIKKNDIQHKISSLVHDLRGINEDEERAFKLLFVLAVKEYQDAQFILEYYHKKGIKNSINVLKALELYNKILEKDIDSDAQYKLKLLCRLREGNILYEVVKDNRKNKKQTTNMNNILLIIVALILCLSFFISNYGLTKNIEDKFALEKHDKKFYDLAEYYIKKDARRAFKYYKGSAKIGNSNAQYKLGMCYHYGIGTKIHKKKAFHLYTKSTKSAKEGHNVAQYELSILYETGEGVNKDEKKSFEIIEELADKEYVSAQHRLGYYYEKGIGTDVNILKALELYHTAAENGITEAIKSSSSLLFKLGEKIIKGETKAFEIVELYQTAKENGNVKVIMSLERLLYELGDKRKAFDIVKELADKEYANAQHRLGYYYEKGIGTHINILKARELYTMAVINGNVEALKSLNDLISNHAIYNELQKFTSS